MRRSQPPLQSLAIQKKKKKKKTFIKKGKNKNVVVLNGCKT